MTALIPGVLSFVFFLYYDILNLRASRAARWIFSAGGLLLSVSTALFAAESAGRAFIYRPILSVAGLVGAFCSLAALLYALFIALPARETYIEGGRRRVIARGIYSLCRHPAVWAFSAFYLSLYIMLASKPSLAAWLLFTALNIAYSAAQDRWILPKVLDGYEEYRKSVPFLIPRFK